MLNWKYLRQAEVGTKPFPFCVVDNFLTDPFKVADEFLPFEHDGWFVYNSTAQVKKACNNWYLFPPETYKLFSLLMTRAFIDMLRGIFDITGRHNLYPDPGLHGGGWHIHGDGGILKPHLDYSIHPKLGLQRKLNLILYLEPNFKASYGGELGFWTGTPFEPVELEREFIPVFNRAVIFDTTMNSWHGMTRSLFLPRGVFRKSIAAYYLCDPDRNAPKRDRANFWETWP